MDSISMPSSSTPDPVECGLGDGAGDVGGAGANAGVNAGAVVGTVVAVIGVASTGC